MEMQGIETGSFCMKILQRGQEEQKTLLISSLFLRVQSYDMLIYSRVLLKILSVCQSLSFFCVNVKCMQKQL